MVTFVGTQTDYVSALKNLLELEYDALEAYDASIKRLTNNAYKSKLQEFRDDHRRHITELISLLREHGEEPPTGASIGKQWLTKGKVILANLVSDEAILAAMVSNEKDTNAAYDRINNREDKWKDSVEFISKSLADEKRHKAWLEEAISES